MKKIDGKRREIIKQNKVRIPKQNRAMEKKESITLAAYALFREKRFHEVSIRMIARAAGVSVGTVYSYFEDKEDIFIAVSMLYGKEIYSQFYKTIEKDISRSDTIEEAMFKIIKKLTEIIRLNFILHMETITLSMTHKRIRDHYATNETKNAERISRLFTDRFKEKIKIRDQEAAMLVTHKAIEEIVQYCLCYEISIPEERVFKQTAKMVAAYLEKDS